MSLNPKHVGPGGHVGTLMGSGWKPSIPSAAPTQPFTNPQIVAQYYSPAVPKHVGTLMGSNFPKKYKGGSRHRKRKTMRRKIHRRKGKSRKH
jgi:hypothetical protein